MYLKGDLAISECGRDMGRLFMITEIIDENYALIADGSKRKLEKPKKKKLKHLKYFGKPDEKFLSALFEGEMTNKLLKKALKSDSMS